MLLLKLHLSWEISKSLSTVNLWPLGKSRWQVIPFFLKWRNRQREARVTCPWAQVPSFKQSRPAHKQKMQRCSLQMTKTCICGCCSITESCPTLFFRPHGLQPTRLLFHGISQARILQWLPSPSPGDLPDLEIKPEAPAWQVGSLPLNHQGIHQDLYYLTIKPEMHSNTGRTTVIQLILILLVYQLSDSSKAPILKALWFMSVNADYFLCLCRGAGSV